MNRKFNMRHNWLIACLLLLGGIIITQQVKMANASDFPRFLAWGFSVEGFPITKNQLEQLEKETKIAAEIIQFYLQWSDPSQQFEKITPSLDAIINTGATPCLTWEPMIIVDQVERAIPYQEILDGRYDAYLNHIANEVRLWKKPLIIRLAHEMNLKRYHWGTSAEEFGPQSPEIYIKLFRYVVNFFKDRQILNVLWAFCPNVDSDPDLPWNKAKYYYPGDQYVDILGMDGYNWIMTPEIAKSRELSWTKPWLSFEQIFIGLYHELKAISPYKPIIVFETASVDRGAHKKSLWIESALLTAKKWQLTGIIWFQSKKEEDWRIQQNEDYSYIPIIRREISPFPDWLNHINIVR